MLVFLCDEILGCVALIFSWFCFIGKQCQRRCSLDRCLFESDCSLLNAIALASDLGVITVCTTASLVSLAAERKAFTLHSRIAYKTQGVDLQETGWPYITVRITRSAFGSKLAQVCVRRNAMYLRTQNTAPVRRGILKATWEKKGMSHACRDDGWHEPFTRHRNIMPCNDVIIPGAVFLHYASYVLSDHMVESVQCLWRSRWSSI